MFDVLPPAMQQRWRENSAKGGRNGKHKDKVRAAKIGWRKSPHRFDKLKAQRQAIAPTGFFCECSKWHDYPQGMPKRVNHQCGCGREHSIVNGIAKLKVRKTSSQP